MRSYASIQPSCDFFAKNLPMGSNEKAMKFVRNST